MKICTVQQIRALDRDAINRFGIPESILMENAALAACAAIEREAGIRGRGFLVFCGLGNNGGDGFAVARKLHSKGGRVKVYMFGDPAGYKGAARQNYEIAARIPLEIEIIKPGKKLARETAHCSAIVDAVFGTGLARNVTGAYADAINLINRARRPVFSLDIPSGIQGDTGEVLGCAVKADFTITFGLPKLGNMLYPGYAYGGKLSVSRISYPVDLSDSGEIKIELNEAPPLPPRPEDGYKGSFGEVLFIAGAASYLGAPYFSSFSFLKAGGGYARLAAPRSISALIAARGSEVVLVPQGETAAGSISAANKQGLLALANRMDMVVIGPGLSLEGETKELARELVTSIRKPVLIDGDGLTAVSENIGAVRERRGPTVMTPHLGEMSRLTGLDVSEIRRNRVDILRRTAADLRAHIVLKGAHTLVCRPDGKIFLNMSGNAGMAKAGTGDVLNGAIAAMFGLGLQIPEAVQKGVFIHGLAADLAAVDRGEDGITPQDIMDCLPLAVRADREGLPEALKRKYTVEETG